MDRRETGANTGITRLAVATNPFGLEILNQVYAPSFEGITRIARAPSGAPALAGPSMAHHQRQVRSHR